MLLAVVKLLTRDDARRMAANFAKCRSYSLALMVRRIMRSAAQ